ncbi:PilZ domain-containing protein [Stutzerimonas stutzeri]|uniref:PilZ domain-containing protein n=1 Tax=Stutzerimonas stutzeri subgroup TaxID=578833 RepID=UPI000C6DE3DD|nr:MULTISPECIES: PilZ domain-containing protein [Stutzerimonas stutzeri subgroup]MCQ2049054.1 PilZ domain-containing protein [Stutzerimonas kunmingensis]PKR25687.1 PilZ domain-containing protein [Stutzerimonas stutzeri]QQC11782.1 PilZ domain-containing protein [Stutzerimonas stutzeri]VEI37607.1 PilZ domain-containing protein [Stutzerimonas stutzeri]
MRQHSRFSFRHISRIQVSNRLNGEPMGYVADLSLGGLRLVASQPLAVGGCYEMVLHVPGHGERVRQVEAVVICQWSRKDSRRDSFEMGFALDRPSAEFTALVAEQAPRRRKLY